MYDINKLKLIRKEKGISIYRMAILLKITPSFYCQLENKKRRLFYDTAYEIASILNLKPDDLFYTKE